jgi:hypothetical protein
MSDALATAEKKAAREGAWLRVSFAVIMVLVGLLGSLVDVAILQRVGLALIVAGTVGLFTEFAFGPYWLQRQPQESTSTGVPGMTMVSDTRTGYASLNSWIVDYEGPDLFFAGRSVLKRMNRDFENKGWRLPEILVHHLEKGSSIKILFLNPKWPPIHEIARQEGRESPQDLFVDLRESFQVVRDISSQLERHSRQKDARPITGSIEIKVYEEISQYAYHCVKAHGRVTMYVGFYFAQAVGYETPLFEVENDAIVRIFARHFDTIFDRAHLLLRASSGGIYDFRQGFYDESVAYLDAQCKPS